MILEIFSQVIPWHIPHPSINFFDPGPKNKNVYFFQIFEKKAEILENLNNWFRLMIYGMSTHLYVWMPYHIGYIDMVSPQYESSCDNKESFLNKRLVTLAALIWSLPSVYGLLVIWHVICPFHEKDFLHWLHWYGLSPVWVLRCIMNCSFSEKALSHSLYWHNLKFIIYADMGLLDHSLIKEHVKYLVYIFIFGLEGSVLWTESVVSGAASLELSYLNHENT